MKTKLRFSIFILVIVLMSACQKADIDLDNLSQEVSLNPSLVVPLGSSRITIGDFLVNEGGGDNFFTDGNEVFYSSTDSMEWKFGNIDLLKNSQSLLTNFPLGSNSSPLPANTSLPTIYTTDSLKFGLNTFPQNERVDSILVERAVLSLIINKTGADFSPENITITLTLPNKQVRFLNPTASTIITKHPTAFGQVMEVVLENFMIVMPNLGSSLPIGIKIDAKSGNTPIYLGSSSHFQTQIIFQELKYAVAYGRFMPKELTDIRLEYNLELFKNKRLGNFYYLFENPQIFITAAINFGAHLFFHIKEIKTYSSLNSDIPAVYAVFKGTEAPTELFIEKPLRPGETVVKNFRTLDKNWGGMDKVLLNSNLTDRIAFNLSLGLDSLLTKNDPYSDFITPDASIKFKIQKKFPLQLKQGSFYAHVDTLKNLSSAIESALDQCDKNGIASAALVLNVINGLPLNVKLKLQMIDSAGVEIQTTLQKEFVIEAAKINAAGVVQMESLTKKLIAISISKEQMSSARRISKIICSERVDGQNAQSKIYVLDSNSFELRLGVFVQANIKK